MGKVDDVGDDEDQRNLFDDLCPYITDVLLVLHYISEHTLLTKQNNRLRGFILAWSYYNIVFIY